MIAIFQFQLHLRPAWAVIAKCIQYAISAHIHNITGSYCAHYQPERWSVSQAVFLLAAFCFLYKVFNNRPLTQKGFMFDLSQKSSKRKTCGKDKWPNQKAVLVRHMAFENVLQGEFRRDCDWIVLDDSWHFNGVVQSHSAIFYAFAYSAYVHMHTHVHLILHAFIYTKEAQRTS